MGEANLNLKIDDSEYIFYDKHENEQNRGLIDASPRLTTMTAHYYYYL